MQSRVYSTGLVVLTGHFKFIAIMDLNEPRPRLLENPGLSLEPESWIVIPPSISLSRHVEVLLATQDSLFQIDSTSCVEQVHTAKSSLTG